MIEYLNWLHLLDATRVLVTAIAIAGPLVWNYEVRRRG